MAEPKTKKISIDEEQPPTVEEHFELILNDTSCINPQHSNVSYKDMPDWYDEELFKKGQDYYKHYRLGVTTAGLAGLMAVFLIPTIAKILVFTGKSSKPCAAFIRYMETILHITALYLNDPKDPDSKFWKSLNTIRWKHSNISNVHGKKRDHGIYQRDMVLTQFGFIGYVLGNPEKLGLPDETDESEERKGFYHMWRVLGHLLDISDRMNLCRKNEQETTLLCKKILEEVYGKHLKEPSKDFYELVEATMDGLSCLDPLVKLDAFYVFLYDLHNRKYEGPVTWSSRLNANYRKLNFHLIRTPIIGFFIRYCWNIYIRFNLWFNEKFPFVAWMRFGKSQSTLHLYPALI